MLLTTIQIQYYGSMWYVVINSKWEKSIRNLPNILDNLVKNFRMKIKLINQHDSFFFKKYISFKKIIFLLKFFDTENSLFLTKKSILVSLYGLQSLKDFLSI